MIACERVSGGYETFIYRARLEGRGALLPAGPELIVRIYRGVNVVERGRWEATAIAAMQARGIPTPPLYLYEPDAAPLGAPFLVLGVVPGRRMDEAALASGTVTVVKLLKAYAEMQTRIQAIDWPEGRELLRAAQANSAFDALAWAPGRLQAARTELQARGLTTLLPVADWLEQNRRMLKRAPEVFVHGDFHPLNIFVEGTRISGILDWGGCGFATRWEDIGWSSMLIATVSSPDKREDRRLAPYRSVAHKIYLGLLWKAGGLDRRALRWGEVYGALRWLLIFLPSYLPDAGPAVLNPDAATLTTPRYVKRVRRFIEKRTKLQLAIA
ncbi:MAG TPA: phosphotransferase [Dehalococcoidia bacterium]|nr:phosphotransferase [Dehalococcoidia bacterium]